MSPRLLSLALFAVVAASTLAEGFGPHGVFYGGYGAAPFHGYGGGYGGQNGYGSNGGHSDGFKRCEKSDWSEANYGGHERHADGESYGKKHADGYGNNHGYNAAHNDGYGYGGEPSGFYGAYGPQKLW